MRAIATAAALVLFSAPAFAFSPKEVYRDASPGVVLVLGADKGGAGSGGTGSIISADGKVITNAHVVINDKTGQPYSQLFIFLKPAKITGDNKRDLVNRYKARVLNYSPAKSLDLALLQIENPPPNMRVIAFADPDKVEIGDEVAAIGHPEGGGTWTLTTGTVSTMIANYGRVEGKHVFQTEASVNRGNSGGPLLDAEGNMIGINTMIARKGAGGIAITDVNFSLKSSVAVKWLAGNAGMGLAYAPKKAKNVVVALAPAPAPEAAEPRVKPVEAPPPVAKPQVVEEPPASTIVVAEAPPKRREVESMRNEGRVVGTEERSERVVAGEKLDPKDAKPTYHTKKRPYNLEDLRKAQIKELEDVMDDMRGMGRKKMQDKDKNKKKNGRGMGLW
ncbi:MAG: trypsin-like peptidase domain-containing protein [Myxococcota bacterium]